MTEEEIFKAAKEIADKAAELSGEARDIDREMAYQQLTDLKTFLAMVEMFEMRIKYEGVENVLSIMEIHKANIKSQIDSITEELASYFFEHEFK